MIVGRADSEPDSALPFAVVVQNKTKTDDGRWPTVPCAGGRFVSSQSCARRRRRPREVGLVGFVVQKDEKATAVRAGLTAGRGQWFRVPHERTWRRLESGSAAASRCDLVQKKREPVARPGSGDRGQSFRVVMIVVRADSEPDSALPFAVGRTEQRRNGWRGGLTAGRGQWFRVPDEHTSRRLESGCAAASRRDLVRRTKCHHDRRARGSLPPIHCHRSQVVGWPVRPRAGRGPGPRRRAAAGITWAAERGGCVWLGCSSFASALRRRSELPR